MPSPPSCARSSPRPEEVEDDDAAHRHNVPSIDGVYQGPGSPNEDRRGGFEHDGWLVPHFDEATGEFMDSAFQKVDAFLLGRPTYDIFAAWVPNASDPHDTVANRLNTLPKYVCIDDAQGPGVAEHDCARGDVASAVRELKDRDGREL